MRVWQWQDDHRTSSGSIHDTVSLCLTLGIDIYELYGIVGQPNNCNTQADSGVISTDHTVSGLSAKMPQDGMGMIALE